MGIVMIRCPATGQEISTGIKVDRPRFECSPVFFAQTYCRFCGTEHQWFAKDAWVAESAASSPRPRPVLRSLLAALPRVKEARHDPNAEPS
jgi:hypothetical protein